MSQRTSPFLSSSRDSSARTRTWEVHRAAALLTLSSRLSRTVGPRLPGAPAAQRGPRRGAKAQLEARTFPLADVSWGGRAGGRQPDPATSLEEPWPGVSGALLIPTCSHHKDSASERALLSALSHRGRAGEPKQQERLL